MRIPPEFTSVAAIVPQFTLNWFLPIQICPCSNGTVLYIRVRTRSLTKIELLNHEESISHLGHQGS